jgi:small conductance mechanosensitive channel
MIEVNQAQEVLQNLFKQLIDFGLKLVGAIILWYFGCWLINLANTLISNALKKTVEITIIRYLKSTVSITLRVILIVAILGYFGVETSSFAALLAAAGIAVGAAWSGLLANFAAGVFMIFLRPFKVGDSISAAGVTGTVIEIGILSTIINTSDNVRTFVGNNKLFSDNIKNFSANPYRRVDIIVQISKTPSAQEAIELIRANIVQIPNVLVDPAPLIEILEFNYTSTTIAIRPYSNNDNYAQVYFDTNKITQQILSEAGYFLN